MRFTLPGGKCLLHYGHCWTFWWRGSPGILAGCRSRLKN